MSLDNAAGSGRFELCFEARPGLVGCANFRKLSLDSLDFEPPKLSDTGPLCHPLAVGGGFRTQFNPPSLVFAGNDEWSAQFVASLFSEWCHQG
jgi:hypothetical protein